MTTSRDVARRAGVSQATVWAVLSGKKFVSEELRVRVLAAVAELDYQPNDLARSLKTGHTGAVGVIVPTLSSPTWNLNLSGVQQILSGHGLTMILAHSGEDYQLERQALAALRRRRVDGLLVAPVGPESRQPLEELIGIGIPIVMNTRRLAGLAADAAVADELGGARAIVSHLLALGRRRIGFIGVPEQVCWTGVARLAGYREALLSYGISPDGDLELTGRSSEENGRAFTSRLLDLPQPPDAIFASTHIMTMGVLGCLKARGLRVPDDIALVSFNDLPWSQYIDPPLTTVRLPQRDLGSTAAQLLVERLQDKLPPEPRLVVLDAELVVRRSCGALSSSSVIIPGSLSQLTTI